MSAGINLSLHVFQLLVNMPSDVLPPEKVRHPASSQRRKELAAALSLYIHCPLTLCLEPLKRTHTYWSPEYAVILCHSSGTVDLHVR